MSKDRPCLPLPDSFIRNVTGAFTNGKAWLDSLPGRIAECEQRYDVTLGPPFDLSYNYVAPARKASGEQVVLKLGVPNPELTSEIRTLALYAGASSVRLLDSDEERGILLMERLIPGERLTSLHDDSEATRIAARIMRALWRPLPADHGFTTVSDWVMGFSQLRNRFSGGTGPFPVKLVEMAERPFDKLWPAAGTPFLLHGDLHHENILSDHERWVVIDPKGVAGEPAFEAATLLHNPDPKLYLDIDVQKRRLDILCEETGLDRTRVVGYAIAHAVLCAWWSFEDTGDGWQTGCACAEVLSRLAE